MPPKLIPPKFQNYDLTLEFIDRPIMVNEKFASFLQWPNIFFRLNRSPVWEHILNPGYMERRMLLSLTLIKTEMEIWVLT